MIELGTPSAELRDSIRKPLHMRFPASPKIGDMPSSNPHRIAHAARLLREQFELGVHHPPLLRAQNSCAHGVGIKCIAVVLAT